jgi:pyridoxal phosphate enzyme (YggS family)
MATEGNVNGERSNGIHENLDRVMGRIAAAAQRSNRNPDEITLVAVTKTHPPDIVLEALACGVRHVGENRIGELEAKRPSVESLLPPELHTPIWHMVGHVQSRKASRAVEVADVIESVDSLKLARRLDSSAAARGRRVPVLLEVNVSGEDSKYGWRAGRWESDAGQLAALATKVAAILELEHVQVQGLMTMAPWLADKAVLRAVFISLRRLLDWLGNEFPEADWRHLSMGMSDDYEIAVEEGATIVRIGRAIFGPRLEATSG